MSWRIRWSKPGLDAFAAKYQGCDTWTTHGDEAETLTFNDEESAEIERVRRCLQVNVSPYSPQLILEEVPET